MPLTAEKRRELRENCPEGYCVSIPGQSIDMLGGTELWQIFEYHPEPHMIRIPEDLADVSFGQPCAARTPKKWGQCLYYKVV